MALTFYIATFQKYPRRLSRAAYWRDFFERVFELKCSRFICCSAESVHFLHREPEAPVSVTRYNGGHAHAAAYAQGGHPFFEIAPPHLVGQRNHKAQPSHADRMTQAATTSVDVCD